MTATLYLLDRLDSYSFKILNFSKHQLVQNFIVDAMGAETLLSHDLVVVIAVALMTMTIQSHVPYYFERKVLNWKELRKGTRSRICVETAVIPSRIMLAYLTLPIVLKGFSPMSTWTPQDTNSALLAW